MKPIAITLGDPSGIGPEIIAKAFRDAPHVTEGCFVVGDVAALRRAVGFVSASAIPLAVALIEKPTQALVSLPRCIPVFQPEGAAGPFAIGQVSAESGRAAGQCIVWAAQAALRGEVAAIVTAPIHKEALALAGAPFASFPGHTEMLQAQAAQHAGKPLASMPVRMMLANDELKVVLVSIHLSLVDAIHAMTFDSVLQTLQITHKALAKTLGRAPRIGVAGLNPTRARAACLDARKFKSFHPPLQPRDYRA